MMHPLFKPKPTELPTETLYRQVSQFRKYLFLPMLGSLVLFGAVAWQRPDPGDVLFIVFLLTQLVLLPFIFRLARLSKELKKRAGK